MPNRIKILEAPKATLGEAGVEQYIPIAEARDTGTVTAKNTTIADMAIYFENLKATFDPVVIDFRFSSQDFFSYDIPPSIPIDGRGQTATIQFREANKTVYAGTGDEIQANDDNFNFTIDGIFLVICQFGGSYSNDGGIGQWRWRFDWLFGGAFFNRSGEGSYIRPQEDAQNTARQIFDFELVAAVGGSRQYFLQTTIRNIGNAVSSEFEEERIEFFQATGILNSGISFIRVA